MKELQMGVRSRWGTKLHSRRNESPRQEGPEVLHQGREDDKTFLIV